MIFDNFWIDLNKAIAMCPEAKAQIYSVNENSPVDQAARMWGVLDQLERTRRKEKDEVADLKVKCKEIVKGCCIECESIFSGLV